MQYANVIFIVYKIIGLYYALKLINKPIVEKNINEIIDEDVIYFGYNGIIIVKSIVKFVLFLVIMIVYPLLIIKNPKIFKNE